MRVLTKRGRYIAVISTPIFLGALFFVENFQHRVSARSLRYAVILCMFFVMAELKKHYILINESEVAKSTTESDKLVIRMANLFQILFLFLLISGLSVSILFNSADMLLSAFIYALILIVFIIATLFSLKADVVLRRIFPLENW